MSADQMAGDAAPYVQLFQRAHQKIVMLERLDEQVQQILTKRQEMQDELRSIQAQLNEEFDSRIRAVNSDGGVRPLVTISPEAKRGGSGRFAAQSMDVLSPATERAAG